MLCCQLSVNFNVSGFGPVLDLGLLSIATDLIHSANADGVLPFAITATPQEPFVALSGLSVNHFININTSAMHTARVNTPALLLKELHCGQFVRTCQRNPADDCRFR